ncbi:MAG: DUF4423 domain-containing protein [Deltaproteobacteria bacterium]|nr:DUF4423 domain-containing protein [Deltaproteobacteria bacterium]
MQSDLLNIDSRRVFLKQELSKRCQKNPRYSLRSFAKALGLSHTVLSLFLSGKRTLSKKATSQVVTSLALSPREQAAFYGESPAKQYDHLSLDSFAAISDWYHYSILSLLELPNAKCDAGWMASQLGISRIQAQLAFERLVRLGLIKKTAHGWRQTGNPLYVGNDVPSAALRKFYRQLLEKATDSLENDPLELRDFSSITFAMNPKFIPYAQKKIRLFRRQLVSELEKLGEPTAVFHLSIQLYPSSRIERGKNEKKCH